MFKYERMPSSGRRGGRIRVRFCRIMLFLTVLVLCFLQTENSIEWSPEHRGVALLSEVAATAAAHAGDNRPWAAQRSGSAIAGIGPEAVSKCRASVCRMCDTTMLHNAVNVIHPSVLAYIERHVLIGVVTGSQDGFFRVDIGLCTWMGHVPAGNLFFFTDLANTSEGRYGTWIETDNTTASKQVPVKMLQGTGYSKGWLRAQYRFFHAFSYFAKLAQSRSSDGRDVRWAIVVDDDTFLDLHALVRFLHRRDMGNVARVAASLEHADYTQSLQMQARCRQGGDITPGSVSACKDFLGMWYNFLQKHPNAPRVLINPKGGALMVGSALWNATTDHLPLGRKQASVLDPIYVGNKGWGGAGHYMNTAALRIFSKSGEKECLKVCLIQKRRASDTSLRCCLPVMGIHYTADSVLTHCQARYLRRRLLDGELVSLHAKRDVVLPKYLAMWRMRLYYQVLYHRNRTAYDVLMQVGSCAHGYTCKASDCSSREEAAAMRKFELLSNSNTRVPLY